MSLDTWPLLMNEFLTSIAVFVTRSKEQQQQHTQGIFILNSYQ